MSRSYINKYNYLGVSSLGVSGLGVSGNPSNSGSKILIFSFKQPLFSISLPRVAANFAIFFMLSVQMINVHAALFSLREYSTDVNSKIEINLANELTGLDPAIVNPQVVIVTGPANGSATALCNDTSNKTCITYTPASNYIGFDTFTITVVESTNTSIRETSDATIKINIGGVTASTSGTTAVWETVSSICDVNSAATLSDFCLPFNNSSASQTPGAIPADLREFLNAISPQDVAAQGTVGYDLANQQIKNIGKHLAALRSGQTIAPLGGLAFHQQGKQFTADDLAHWMNPNEKHKRKTESAVTEAEKVAALPDLNLEDYSGGAASADNQSGNTGWFINGVVGSAKQIKSEYEDGFKFSTNGVTNGIDYKIGRYGYVGIAGGYANSQLDMDYGYGGLQAEGYTGTVYGSFYPSKSSYIDLIVSGSNYTFDNSRRIVFGSVDSFAYSSNKSNTTALKVNGGFSFFNRRGWSGNLELSAQKITSNIQGFAENGSSSYNVTLDDRTINRTTASLGGEISYAYSLSRGVLIPQFDMYLVHRFEQDADTLTAYFNEDPDKTLFTFTANAPDANYFQSNIGVSFLSPGGTTMFLQIGATLSQEYYSGYQVASGVRIEF